MGWTSYMASYYKKDGKVDRKAEMDQMYNWEDESRRARVLKSVMYGSVYYAAVEILEKKTGTSKVSAVVGLTSTRWSDGMNFGYKPMDETMGPCYYDCPKRILDLLSPTDDEWALAWREECLRTSEKRKRRNLLTKLPVGSVIRYQDKSGNQVELVKHSPAYQFKRPFWLNLEKFSYVPKECIPDGYTVVAET